MLPFNFECKHVEALNVYKAMQQAVGDSGPDQTPVVVHKRNNHETLVTMRADDWMQLIQDSFISEHDITELVS